jgi:hypothetical protein
VADSLINSDFADFHCITGVHWCAFGLPGRRSKVTHKLQGPKQSEFRNMIRGSAKGSHEWTSPAKQGIPWELLQAAPSTLLEAHDRPERLLFAKGIDRHALGGSGSVS